MDNTKSVLVLGATGGIGGELARQLLAAGWQVRAMRRGDTPPARGDGQGDGIRWLRGDALSRADVLAAAKGCAVIVHAVNPPGYRNWGQLVLPMLDNTIAAAIARAPPSCCRAPCTTMAPTPSPHRGACLRKMRRSAR